MCGIAGIVALGASAAPRPDEVNRMCATIVHRGPDDQGTRVFAHAALGMRRLSIIDLVSGNQPLHNEDKSVWVVFNGEIYNFPELKAELERAGHSFYTKSDTEVIVHLYEDCGSEFAKKLRGMFAIALYDEKRDRLLLARDRLGKKPLVYAEDNGRLLFASEIREILALAPQLSDLNHAALLQYFQFGYILDPQTAYNKIRRLPPGHILECEAGRIRVSPFWEVPQFSEDTSRSEAEWLELMEQELTAAVRMRLISDVPLGALLSGGVDSSLVVGLMAKASSRPVKTFSIAFDEQDFDERQYARMVARQFQTEHHELTMHPEFIETLHALTSLLEEPFGDASMLPTYHVSRLVRQHVKVALSGDGGDELFAGYDRYAINLRRNSFGFIPASVGRFYRDHLFSRLPVGMRGRRFLYNVTLPFCDRYLDSMSLSSALDRDRSLFSCDFLASVDGLESPRRAYERLFDGAGSSDLLGKLQYLDIRTYLAADILPKVDRMSMAASLETRAPLLDHVFVELAARIPAIYKLRNGESKYLLKRLAERIGVPREAIYRKKKGFAVPLVHWFRGVAKAELWDILTDSRTLQRGYFDPRAVRNLLREHQNVRDRSMQLWLLLIFELWHRNFLEPLQKGTLLADQWSDQNWLSSHPVMA